MKHKDIKIDEFYRVRIFKKRPGEWNSEGEMDHFMGKTIQVRSKSPTGFRIYRKPYSKKDWVFSARHVEGIAQSILPDKLFEI